MKTTAAAKSVRIPGLRPFNPAIAMQRLLCAEGILITGSDRKSTSHTRMWLNLRQCCKSQLVDWSGQLRVDGRPTSQRLEIGNRAERMEQMIQRSDRGKLKENIGAQSPLLGSGNDQDRKNGGTEGAP